MEDQEVKYKLILDGIDRLEAGMKSAKSHGDALTDTMHHLKSMVLEVVGAYAGFEVLKESLVDWEHHRVAVAELSQMYSNNSGNIKENLDQLKELAEQQEKLTGIHSENTMAAEQNLLKYKDLKVSYEELIPLSGDLATGLKTDIADAANLLGRALENPLRAARLLMQTGASPEQQKHFKNLEAQGQAAKAQAYLVDILKDKYKDLAKTAFDNDPTAQLAIGFKEVKESIGELIEKGLIVLMPYIKDVFEAVKGFVSFLQNHKSYIVDFGIALTTVAVAMTAFKIASYGSAVASGINTAAIFLEMVATDGLTAAFYAAGIGATAMWGAVTLGLSLVIPAIYELQLHFEGFKEFLWGIGYAAKQIFSGIGDAVLAVFDPANAVSHLKDMMDRFGDITSAFRRGQMDAHTAFVNDQTAASKEKREGSPSPIYNKIKKTDNINNISNQADKVTGTKQVIINVSINKLVEMIKIEAKNIKEGANTAASDVAKAMLGAVDQFSASTDI